MKSIKDIDNKSVAILCPTQEDWDILIKLLREERISNTLTSSDWNVYGEKSAVCIEGHAMRCYIDWYIGNGYELHPLSDYLKQDIYEIY